MAAYGLYTHIRSNRIRSVLLLAGLFVLIYVIVFALALGFRAFTGRGDLSWYLYRAWLDLGNAWPWATGAALVWIAIAYKFNEKIVDAVTGAHEVTRKEEPRLYNLLENLCISRGITMPRLKIMETGALNAFASGLNQKQYAVTVTTGLVDRLDDAELEAVLAHELTHIRNGDVRLMVIATIVSGIVGFLAEVMFRSIFDAGGSARPTTWSRRSDSSSSSSGSSWGGSSSGSSSSSDSKGGGAGAAIAAIVIAIVLIFLAWFLSTVIRLALSRSREFLADAGAVELTKNPDAMIMALRKIEGRGELPNNPSAIMEMCVDNPRSGFVDLFSTHPAIDTRVDALVRTAGGRDPGPIMIDEETPLEEETGEEAEAQAGDTAAPETQAEKPQPQKSPFPGFPGGLPGGAPIPLPIPIPGLSNGKPFLPSESPLGNRTRGPWGPRGEN
jgi:heat shock protein HtpX